MSLFVLLAFGEEQNIVLYIATTDLLRALYMYSPVLVRSVEVEFLCLGNDRDWGCVGGGRGVVSTLWGAEDSAGRSQNDKCSL
jgi:hypothetical protein